MKQPSQIRASIGDKVACPGYSTFAVVKAIDNDYAWVLFELTRAPAYGTYNVADLTVIKPAIKPLPFSAFACGSTVEDGISTWKTPLPDGSEIEIVENPHRPRGDHRYVATRYLDGIIQDAFGSNEPTQVGRVCREWHDAIATTTA